MLDIHHVNIIVAILFGLIVYIFIGNIIVWTMEYTFKLDNKYERIAFVLFYPILFLIYGIVGIIRILKNLIRKDDEK